MTTYNWLCKKSDSKFSRRLLVQCDSTRKNVNLDSLTLIMAESVLIEMFGGIILGFTRNVAENYNPNEMEFGLEKEYGDNGSQGIINACSPENHEENICEPDWNVRYACVVCLLSSHISLAGPTEGLRCSEDPMVENHFRMHWNSFHSFLVFCQSSVFL